MRWFVLVLLASCGVDTSSEDAAIVLIDAETDAPVIDAETDAPVESSTGLCGGVCEVDSDCGAGRRCVFPTGWACQPAPTDESVYLAAGFCRSSDECPLDSGCLPQTKVGVCARDCEGDADCGTASQKCVHGSCVSMAECAGPGAPCQEGTSCLATYESLGYCRAPCSSRDDCRPYVAVCVTP